MEIRTKKLSDDENRSLVESMFPQDSNSNTKKNIYFDEKGNIVGKEEATRFIRNEYDKEGNMVSESFGVVNNGESSYSGIKK